VPLGHRNVARRAGLCGAGLVGQSYEQRSDVDLAIRRWQTFTGEVAALETNGCSGIAHITEAARTAAALEAMLEQRPPGDCESAQLLSQARAESGSFSRFDCRLRAIAACPGKREL
jgi:hypothetical protein